MVQQLLHAAKLLFICIMWFIRTFYETVRSKFSDKDWMSQAKVSVVDLNKRGHYGPQSWVKFWGK